MATVTKKSFGENPYETIFGPRDPDIMVLYCEAHDIPLGFGGHCDKCGFAPDLQSVYLREPEPSPEGSDE